MPSPFPGMDPYLEAPDLWPDLHDALAAQIRTTLNATLPAPYYARLDMRPEVGIVGGRGQTRRRIIPDIAVARALLPPGGAGAVAVLEAPRQIISIPKKVRVRSEPLRHAYVEVRDSKRAHELVTLIEIASPSNKREGVDRKAYLKKQREVLDSNASLIELDLLRDGERLLPNPDLEDLVTQIEPAPEYLVLVNRWWDRTGEDSAYDVYPVLLDQALPCVPVPLRQSEDETPLDLQYVFQQAYDGGPYHRGAVDYDQPPEPLLTNVQLTWARECIRNWRGKT
jgi:hypothetical protein